MIETNEIKRIEMSMKLMEQSIKNELSKCELWGDLPYSKEDYDRINNFIKLYLNDDILPDNFIASFRRYPYTFTTDLIRFVIYDYVGNGVWPSWTSQFDVNISPVQQGQLGKVILRLFEIMDFEIVNEGGFTYVTPVLYQAGVCNFMIGRLYDLLWSTIGSPYFDDAEFYDEVTGYRNSLLDSTGQRYFKNASKAIDLIAEVREIIGILRELDSLDEIAQNTGLNSRYVEVFFEWKKNRNNFRRNTDKRMVYYLAPKLYYDDLKGVCIKLPPQNIEDESIDTILWEVICDNTQEKISVTLPVYYQDRQTVIGEEIVPVSPSSSYTITIYNQDDKSAELYSPWKINGLNKDVPYMLFAIDGASFVQSQISQKGSILVRLSDVKILNKESLMIQPYFGLTQKWKQYVAEIIIPNETASKASLLCSGVVQDIEVRRSVELKLVQLNTLFEENYGDYETPVYVQFPIIELLDSYKLLQTLNFKNWKITLRNKSLNLKDEFMLGDCSIKLYEDSTRFTIPNNIKEKYQTSYGEYDIKLTLGKNTIVQSFYYVPYMEYQGELLRNKHNFYLDTTRLHIKRNEDIQLLLDNDYAISDSSIHGERWVQIEGVHSKSYIRGLLKINHHEKQTSISIPFRKRISNVEWKFWNENENTETHYGHQLFEPKDLVDGGWSCFMSLQSEQNFVRIALESSKGEQKTLQERIITKDRKNSLKIPLNSFFDTIRLNALPQKIMCYITEDDSPICLGIVRKISKLKNIKYLTQKDKSYLYWDNSIPIIGMTMTLKSVSNPDADDISFRVDKTIGITDKNQIKHQGIRLSIDPPGGLYMVEVDEETDDFFFEDEIKPFIIDSDKLVDIKSHDISDDLNDCQSIGQWARCYLNSLSEISLIDKVHLSFSDRIKKEVYQFDPISDLEIFLRLVSVVQQAKDLEENIASILKDFFAEVNLRFITSKDRSVILKKILGTAINREDFIKLEYGLQLFLVEKNDSALLTREEMRKLWELDEKLAILVTLKGFPENRYVDTSKMLIQLNSATLKKVISFQPNQQCGSDHWEDCFDNVLLGKCKCSSSGFPASDKLWGNIEEFNEMFISNKNDVQLKQLSEIHTDGYDFLGSNYLSTIYRWLQESTNPEKGLWRKASEYQASLKDMASKRLKNYRPLLNVVGKRNDGGSNNPHDFFYSIGIGAILEASGAKDSDIASDLRRIHKFWDYAFRSFPKLVMRDLIIAELYIKFNRK